MLDFLIWFIIISLLGWLSFPIAFRVFKKLPSRGLILSKVLGMLLWAFFFWILVSLRLLQNDLPGQLVAFIMVLALAFTSGWKDRFRSLLEWLKTNKRLILTAELFFLTCFALWAFVRSANPAIVDTEKPMEMAFITSILRSPAFPPNDPWLSGYGISYYYFGYIMIAMLIRVTGTAASIGYNLSAALWFALTAISAYSVLSDILKIRWIGKNPERSQTESNWINTAALLAPLMLLIVSNWHGFLDILHARGLFWSTQAGGDQTSRFWAWLNLNELNSPPIGRLSWLPTRPAGVQWWAASRVIQDFKLTGSTVEVIDEFPFFSYLLSDLHPHVLAMPFVLLIISQALNLFWGGMSGSIRLFKWQIPFSWSGSLLAIVSLGGLAFLNTWDFPFYLALMAAAFVLERAYRLGWNSKRIWELILVMAGLGIPSILLYLPFFLSFSSQAGGIYPSLIFFTRGIYFWIMFGPMLVPLLIFLIYTWVKNRQGRNWKMALSLTLGLLLILSLLNWGLSFLASRLPELSPLFLWLQGGEEVGIVSLMAQAFIKRLLDPGTWLTLSVIIFLTAGLLLKPKKIAQALEDPNSQSPWKGAVNPTTLFVLLLVLWGALLALAPEFIYLRDQFSTRMNTIFKFFFQTWILWSLSASYAMVILWRKSVRFSGLMRGLLVLCAILGLVVFAFSLVQQADNNPIFQGVSSGQFGSLWIDWLIASIGIIFFMILLLAIIKRQWMWIPRVLIILGVSLGLVYPFISLWSKTGGFDPYGGFTLDGSAYYRQVWPDQMEAVDWLLEAPSGVMVEAVSPTGGSYTSYASVSTFSGMPTVLGWVGHEHQWRGGGEEVGSRQADIQTLYSTASWDETQRIIDMYNIRYIYIGELERNTYSLNEDKFIQHLDAVFQAPNAVIYEIPQNIGH